MTTKEKYYCVVYWYTTKLKSGVFRVKNGSARRSAESAEAAAIQRIKEQVTAKDSDDPFILLHVEDVSDKCETGELHESLSRLRQLEQNWLHAEQKRMGMWAWSENDKSEWFFDPKQESVDNVVNVGKSLITEWRTGIRAQVSFPPMAFQQELIDAMHKRFLEGSTDQLLAAVMRSGKCFITYQYAKKCGFKRILVATGKTGVNDGWEELLPTGDKPHIDFADWRYNNYNKLKLSGLTWANDNDLFEEEDAGDVEVVFVSLQYLNRHIDNSNSKLMNDIKKVDWDLVVFDEQHWATTTVDTKKIIDTLKFSSKLELSGTAYKTLIEGRYDSADVHTFDYIDEQYRRFNGTAIEKEQLALRADINFAMVDIPESIKSIIDDEGFSIAKLFAVKANEDTFKNVQHVTDFVNFVKKRVYNNQYDNMDKFKPYVDLINRHTLWVIPESIKSADALANLLEAHPYFKGFRVIKAYGNNIKGIDAVKSIIAGSDAGSFEDTPKGTITLTMGRFLEGTTVPEWYNVLEINDSKSASNYMQGAFRNKSGNKKHTIVYDFNPQRFLQVIYDINIDNARRQSGETTTDLVRQWCEVSDVYDYDDNGWTLLSGEDISKRIKQNVEVKVNMFRPVRIQKTAITDEIIERFEDFQLKRNWSATTMLNDQGMEKGKNQDVQGKIERKKKEQDTDELQATIEKMYQAFGKIYNSIWNTVGRQRIGSFDDLCDYEDPRFILITTGLRTDDWKMLKETGVIDANAIKQINSRIDDINEALNETY
jgi:hypothetical protein